MRLGLSLGYWGADSDIDDNLKLAREAERLGYRVCWTSEAYGSDAATVLAFLAARTERIELGAAVFQIPARAPAMTAMTAATLDALSGGRFRLGLGVSGPQVSEGWYGVRFDQPLERTREYVEIVRKALARERLRHEGRHFQLPLPDGPGKALKLTVHPAREHIPLYLGSIGPRNLELTGEIADGWLGLFFSPEHAEEPLRRLRAGRERSGRDLTGFDIAPTVPAAPAPSTRDDDLEAAAWRCRPHYALYIGGMGSRERNFYNRLAGRMGFDHEAHVVQQRFLAADYGGAAEAVPFRLVDQTALLGPRERMADRLRAYAAVGVTTLTVGTTPGELAERVETIRAVAEALDAAGVGD